LAIEAKPFCGVQARKREMAGLEKKAMPDWKAVGTYFGTVQRPRLKGLRKKREVNIKAEGET